MERLTHASVLLAIALLSTGCSDCGSSPSPSPSPPAGGQSQQPEVLLSTAVALEQTTPSGTMMSFSVDYKFTSGGPDGSTQYFWVIEPSGSASDGSAGKFPVQLTERDTLQTLAPQWRSKDGPYYCHIEHEQRNPPCESIALQ